MKLTLFLILFTFNCFAQHLTHQLFKDSNVQNVPRINVESPWFPISEDDVKLYSSYSGWNEVEQKRVSTLNIGPESLELIRQAQDKIVISAFLFDNMYAQGEPYWDIVTEITDLLIQKKQENPQISIAMIFGPLHRAYARRTSPKVKQLLESGIDIFYSDLLPTKAHTPIKIVEGLHHFFRGLDRLTFGILSRILKKVTYLKVPFTPDVLDGEQVSLQMAFNAGLLKANHRKILVTQSGEEWSAVVGSANPHNPSIPSANYAVSVKGEAAKFIYNTLRSDISNSIKLGSKDYVLWHKGAYKDYRKSYLEKILPFVRVKDPVGVFKPQIKFVTEYKVKESIIKSLQEVEPDDRVRIQMFYLSDIEVVDAIMKASQKTKYPVEILLDPNKDAFNKIKDGTPNRQVGALLMNNLEDREYQKLKRFFGETATKEKLNQLNLVIRWYNTTGEQNHSKIMSITNESTDKYVLINGSANWTGKNLDGINMEANLIIQGARRITQEFNNTFDMLFNNQESGITYSLPYEHEVYSQHAGLWKWLTLGETFGFVSW